MTDTSEKTLSVDRTLVDGAPSTMTTAVVFKRGDRVGRYVVLEKVGAGGMGVVYGAFDPKLGRRVALKLLHSHESESRVSVGHDRLLREAQATARLSHRNTVAIHDVGEHGGRVFLAMEYVSGRTLRELIEQDTPPWRDVLRLYCDAGEGLAAAHDKELVHRDFKPDNVTVDTAGRVRVMDFGLAVAAADSTSRGGSSSRLDEPEPETPDGRAQVVGTPAYMAPEQFEGSVVGPAADQFSFCVSLYEGLYSERPFAGASTHEIARSVTLGELRPAPRSDVPRWVRQAVLRGLATNPTERHASMRALLDALAPPSRRFRRGAITVGVLGAGVVATAVVGLHARDARRLARCETVAAEAHAAWDAEAQARVESAIRNASLSFGDRATADARRGLDEYVERWAEARRQVCTTATIDHTLEDALARRAVACLDDRRAEFEQLVEQMGAADRSALVGAGWAAAGLPAPAECTDVAALTRQVDWTAVSPELAADLAAASAALALEAWNESLARSDSALVLAEAVGGRAEQARAHQLRADALFGLGDSRAAQQAHLAAFENAYLAGALKIAFHSAIALALLERDLRNDHLQARSWTSLASALLEQAGVAKETLPWAEAARAQAVLEATHGNVAAAREEFTRALRIRESVLGPRHPLALESRAHLASVSLRDGDPNAALEQYADLESAFEDAFGRGHPRFAWLLQNMAGAHSRVGSGRAAIAAYRQAVDILERTYGPRHPATLVAKSQLGTEYVAENDADEAHPLLQDAVEAANEILPAGDRRTVEAMVALAGVHHLRGEASLAEQWLSRASETLKPDPANQALASTILANRGLIANEDGRPTEARQLLERALAVAGAAKAEPLLLGQVRITLADIEREDELFASALSHYEAGLALFESVNAAGLLQARAHFGVAQMLDALGLDATRVAEQRQLALQAIDGVRGSFADEVRHNIAEAMRKAEQEGGQATVNAESGPGRPESGG